MCLSVILAVMQTIKADILRGVRGQGGTDLPAKGADFAGEVVRVIAEIERAENEAAQTQEQLGGGIIFGKCSELEGEFQNISTE